MKSIYWILLTCTILALIIARGLYMYFVSQFCAVYPPIKEYEIQISASDLKNLLSETTKDQNKVDFKFTDTVGTMQNGFAYYIDLKIIDQNNEIQYTLKYYNLVKQDNLTFLRIDLISAFNKTNNSGGYKMKDTDVPRLVEIFEREFIENIKSELEK